MRILVADDDRLTRTLVEKSLEGQKYEITLASNGNQAWETIQKDHPDIILLDWVMPGLDGLEICQRLQTAENKRFVYIILLTANNHIEDILKGLDAGANDYITKPFNFQELKSRLAVGVRVSEYQNLLLKMNDVLRRYSLQMEELAQERAQQLVQAERLVTLGTMAAGIAHEINTPLTVLQGNIRLLKRAWESDWAEILEDAARRKPGFQGYQQAKELLGMLDNAVQRIRQIIDGMRNFSHGKGGEVEIYQPEACLREALEICLPKTKHSVSISREVEPLPFTMKGNPVQITQVLVNLIGNAVDALSKRPEPRITVTLKPSRDHAVFAVQDNGSGIPPEDIEKLWSPFYTTKPRGQGTGLGLFICHTIVEEHGGSIQVNSTPGAGTTFVVELPSEKAFDNLPTKKPPKSPRD